MVIGHHIDAFVREVDSIVPCRPQTKQQIFQACEALKARVLADIGLEGYKIYRELIFDHAQFRSIRELVVTKRTSKQLRAIGLEVYACPVCGQAARKKCAGCRCVRYCSRECQVQDWSRHKRSCEQAFHV